MGLNGGLVWELVDVSVGYLFFGFVIGPLGAHWGIQFVGVRLGVRLVSLGASIIGSFAVSVWGFIKFRFCNNRQLCINSNSQLSTTYSFLKYSKLFLINHILFSVTFSTVINAHPLIFSASGRNLSKWRPFNQILEGKTDVNPAFWHGNGYPQVIFIYPNLTCLK